MKTYYDSEGKRYVCEKCSLNMGYDFDTPWTGVYQSHILKHRKAGDLPTTELIEKHLHPNERKETE